jgi:hypothetical protein
VQCLLSFGQVPAAGGAAPLHLFVDTFIADGTWTKPASIQSPSGVANAAHVRCAAPGAGGTTNTGGGGGGAVAISPDLDVSGAATFDFAGIAATAANTDAASCTFGTTLVVADGGLSGANGGTGGQASSSTGTIKRDGGNAVLGTGNQSGGGSAGDDSAASGTTPGEPNGGHSAAGALAGRGCGAGGGSTSGAGGTGARGMGQVMYRAPATSGYARRTGIALWRSTGDNTTHNVDLTDLGTIPAGAILEAWVAADGNPTVSATDWTSVVSDANSTSVRGALLQKTATGSDTLTITLSASEQCAVIVLMYEDAVAPTATSSNGSAANANPPAHTPASGKYWVRTGLMVDASALSIITAVPANYGGFLEVPAFTTAGAHLYLCERQVDAAGDDPGAWTHGTEQHVAITATIGGV